MASASDPVARAAELTTAVLTSVGIGVWRWNRGEGVLEADARTRELLDLPADGPLPSAATIRARLHGEDFVRLSALAQLTAGEQRPDEIRVRVVSPDGRLLRGLHVQLSPGPAGSPYSVQGTVLDGRSRFCGTDASTTPGFAAAVRPAAARPSAVPGDAPLDANSRRPGAAESPAAVPAPGAEDEDREHRQIRELNALPAAAPRLPAADLRRSREAFLLDAGRALAEAGTTSEVLRVAATLAMPGFSPDGQAVFGVKGTKLTVVGHHGHTAAQAVPFEMPLDTEYPAATVVRTGRPIYLSSPAAYQRDFPATWPLAAGFGRQSWAFLPLVTAGRTTGAWLAAFETAVGFTPDERAVLSTVARMLSQALERAHTNEAERALSRGLRRSMGDSAREIDGLTVTARYVPTGGGLLVGGDWYDVIDLPGGRIALVVGDVQGHDVHAAGVMSRLRTAVHAYAVEGHRPDAVLSRASRFLASVDEDRFATCLYIEADPARGRLEIARAGHPHPVLRMPDGTTVIRHVDGGLPLGLAPEGEDYPVTEVELQVGEILMVCTDGLIETGGHDMFSGWVRVRDVMAPGPAHDLEGMADALIRAVHGPGSHRGPGRLADRREDDIALLLLRRDPIDGAPRPVGRRLMLTVGQGQPAKVGAARRELRAILQDWNSQDAADAAVLLVSELLTNVLLHTDQEGALLAELWGAPGERRLRIEVSDGSDELPHRRSPGEMASSGRGLVLLDLLAERWGVRPSGEGKVVWFEMNEKPDGQSSV
ncbi:ATP-binding SpoIIE family protein phosphatase [Streptacidiphilus jiangxiensis]|uniref:protein-serine/threonine phosphatase n=1 Tax=Streptacidiphilus jiangxiensis TaxID=235985 RepID=A0A1H7Y8W2_STRJI|nr:SpoIIE family protein phosphatase [Streptacidiphilus jiangxiensis]SEM42351.1 GAF domain-containing protein [Streptacidiphilus jiangxiensis]